MNAKRYLNIDLIKSIVMLSVLWLCMAIQLLVFSVN